MCLFPSFYQQPLKSSRAGIETIEQIYSPNTYGDFPP